MQVDMFGQPVIHASKKSKKTVSTKKIIIALDNLVQQDMPGRGLNAVYATGKFGEWIVENRGNKTSQT